MDARSWQEVPKVPRLEMAREMLFSQGRQRIDMLTRLEELYRRLGPVVARDAGRFRMVNLYGPEANRAVLKDRERIFSSKKPWTMIMGRIFPAGLLLRDGDEHKHHRRIMHTAFQRPALREYLVRMNPMIEKRLVEWGHQDGPLLAFKAIKELTLDMAATIFLGADLGPGTRRMNGVFENLVAASMSRIRLPIPGLEFQRGLKGREFMIRYLGDLIPAKRSAPERDMFSRLCHAQTEEGQRFSDQEVIDHMVFLMMAAHDTTTSTLSSLVYELAKHPEWQERVREECLGLGSAHLEFEELDQLVQLGWVMKETLRRYPPLPIIPRVATRAFEFGGYRIPEGSMVVIAPIHTHHMSEWWDAPKVFDPERFSPQRAEDERHTHSWIPFGGGLHHCLGIRFAEIQVKAVVHHLVRRYRWSVPEGYEMPVQQAPISKPRDGLPIQLEGLAS